MDLIDQIDWVMLFAYVIGTMSCFKVWKVEIPENKKRPSLYLLGLFVNAGLGLAKLVHFYEMM
jgi:hypothetical protein